MRSPTAVPACSSRVAAPVEAVAVVVGLDVRVAQVGEAQLLVALAAHRSRALGPAVGLRGEALGLELALLGLGPGHLCLGVGLGGPRLVLAQPAVVLDGLVPDLGGLVALGLEPACSGPGDDEGDDRRHDDHRHDDPDDRAGVHGLLLTCRAEAPERIRGDHYPLPAPTKRGHSPQGRDHSSEYGWGRPGGSSPTRPSTASRSRSACPVCRPYSSMKSTSRRRSVLSSPPER